MVGVMAIAAAVEQRPLYHFQPPANWMNDPNGLIQWGGWYHLFYQYNPRGPFHGTIHWGHARSRDLVRWEHLPMALTPTPGAPDEAGCYSGCAVDDDGVPTLMYTGVRGERPYRETQCLATSADGLRTWRPHAGNPMIAAPPDGLDVVGFRDPYVWREGDAWYCVIGSGIRGVGGTVFLYRSADLVHWEYLHPLLQGDQAVTEPVWTGSMWECPQFFPLGEKYVLLISVWDEAKTHYTAYYLGTYRDHIFTPDEVRRFDTGANYYAPAIMRDERGRRLIWGWSWEGRSPEAQRAAGWAGVMSLPRVLTPRDDGGLGVEPAPELQALRRERQRRAALHVTPSSKGLLPDVRGDALEIIAEFDQTSGDARRYGLLVRCAPEQEEYTRVVYDRVEGRLFVDRGRASLDPDVHRGAHGGAFELTAGEPLRLHVYLDRSIVEVYANGRACLTERIYPSRPDSIGVDLFADGGDVTATSVDVWELAPGGENP
jgi:beta-fructofuranosidase